jgi:hypothetical protein
MIPTSRCRARAPFAVRGLLVPGLLLVATAPAPGLAQVLDRNAFSSGATDASGGGLRLRATLGEVGFVGHSVGASFAVGQGFWARAYVSIASDAPAVSGASASFVNELAQSFPNPFRDATTISFGVARPSPVRLHLFDVGGRRVATLLDEALPAGRYQRRWSGLDDAGHPVASGVYFYRLEIGDWSRSRRLLKLN